MVMAKVKPINIADWLKAWDDKLSMRKSLLGLVKTMFSAAIGAGWVETNPAIDLKSPSPVVARERLSLDQFKAIREKAHPKLRQAMDLAIFTGTRRSEALSLRFDDMNDGYLHVRHIKDGLNVRLPLTMRLPELDTTLAAVIKNCRDSVVSPYIIHHSGRAGKAKPGDNFGEKYIEVLFRDARTKAGITKGSPPTFHEIRSLSNRIWKSHGLNVKTLLGHKSQKMSDMYNDERDGEKWVTLAI